MRKMGRTQAGPLACFVLALAVGCATALAVSLPRPGSAAAAAAYQGRTVVEPGGSVLLRGKASFTSGRTVTTFRIPRYHRSHLRLSADARADGRSAYRATVSFARSRPRLRLVRIRNGRTVVLDQTPLRQRVRRGLRIELAAIGDRVKARAWAPSRRAPRWQTAVVDRRPLTGPGRPRAHVKLDPRARTSVAVDYALAAVVNGTRQQVPIASGGTTTPPTPTPTPTPTTPPAGGCPLLGVYQDANQDLDYDSVRQFGALPQVANSYYQPTQRINIAKETARIRRGTSPNITITAKGTDIIEALGTGPSHPSYASASAWLDRYVNDLVTLANVDPSVPVYATIDHEFAVKRRLGMLTGKSADPVYYGRALDRFYTRVEQRSTLLRTSYWMVGYDRALEGAVAQQFTTLPRQILFDPYAGDSWDTLTSIVAQDAAWIRAQSWYVGQDIGLGEFGVRVILGDTAMSKFLTDIRQQLADLDISWAVYFNRQKDLDTRIAERTDGKTFPLAQARYGAALQATGTC